MSFSSSAVRAVAVPVLLLLLILAAALSLLVGAKPLPASVIVDALTGTCQSADCIIVLDARLPRTLAGLLAGGALGLAGALMQTLTRNPLADPGILGVNSGASFAIVLGAALFGFSSPSEQLMMAFCGALAASIGGRVMGTEHRGERAGYLLAFGYLIGLSVLGVVPEISPAAQIDAAVRDSVALLLPLALPLLLLFPARAPQRKTGETFDLFYGMLVFLVLAVLVLGALAYMPIGRAGYVESLF